MDMNHGILPVSAKFEEERESDFELLTVLLSETSRIGSTVMFVKSP